jgi:hypothetical protein
MPITRRDFATGAAALPLLTSAATSASAQQLPQEAPLLDNPHEAALLEAATEAYIYGYPLITMDMTRRVMTNVATSSGTMGAPMGQFANAREYPDAAFRAVTAPNADTLYSVAWLDLVKEPYILELPEEDGRFYLMPMLSGWTNVFAVPGKRTTGTGPQRYLIAGPQWSGSIPTDAKLIAAPTNMVWILGRTFCSGAPEEYKAVHAIQDNYKLTPLSAYGKPYTPPPGQVDPSVDMKTAVRTQVGRLDPDTYFTRLAMLMVDNPPSLGDGVVLAKLASLGIVVGQPFKLSAQSPEIQKAIEQAPAAAIGLIKEQDKHAGRQVNGWTFSTRTGYYGQDYVQRAFITAVGLGANLPQDAIYPMTLVDNEGRKLNGASKYVIRFAKGELPPVNGFWSLTMYDQAFFFVANPLNRYTISPRNNLKTEADGSTVLYVQSMSPGVDKESNWLPAPQGMFVLMMRFYGPSNALLDGTWELPPVTRVLSSA